MQIWVDPYCVDDRENRVEEEYNIGRNYLENLDGGSDRVVVDARRIRRAPWIRSLGKAHDKADSEYHRSEHACQDRENQQRARAVAQLPLEGRQALP